MQRYNTQHKEGSSETPMVNTEKKSIWKITL